MATVSSYDCHLVTIYTIALKTCSNQVEFLKIFDTSAAVWVDTGDGVPRPKSQNNHALFGHLFGQESEFVLNSGDIYGANSERFRSPVLEGASPREVDEPFAPTEDIILSETAPIVVDSFILPNGVADIKDIMSSNFEVDLDLVMRHNVADVWTQHIHRHDAHHYNQALEKMKAMQDEWNEESHMYMNPKAGIKKMKSGSSRKIGGDGGDLVKFTGDPQSV
jgi:hypothetical protein